MLRSSTPSSCSAVETCRTENDGQSGVGCRLTDSTTATSNGARSESSFNPSCWRTAAKMSTPECGGRGRQTCARVGQLEVEHPRKPRPIDEPLGQPRPDRLQNGRPVSAGERCESCAGFALARDPRQAIFRRGPEIRPEAPPLIQLRQDENRQLPRFAPQAQRKTVLAMPPRPAKVDD